MTHVPSQSPDPTFYRREADTFVGIMSEFMPEMWLDYSPASIAALEQFVQTQFDPPGSKFVGENLIVGVGCYIGETIIRQLGGHWHEDGSPIITAIGPISAINPIQKAASRFRIGASENLVTYYDAIARYGHGQDS